LRSDLGRPARRLVFEPLPQRRETAEIRARINCGAGRLSRAWIYAYRIAAELGRVVLKPSPVLGADVEQTETQGLGGLIVRSWVDTA
jgi:hypothetical protein